MYERGLAPDSNAEHAEDREKSAAAGLAPSPAAHRVVVGAAAWRNLEEPLTTQLTHGNGRERGRGLRSAGRADARRHAPL